MTPPEAGRVGLRRSGFGVAALVAVVGVLCLPVGSAGAATLRADPSSLGAVFASAQAGDVIELVSGSYSFGGGSKSGVVTLRPAVGAAPVMRASFNSVSNIRLERLAISGLGVGGGSHDVAVVASRFTGQAYLNVTGSVGANIVLDGNRFEPWSVGPGAAEGRLHITQPAALGSAPVGVRVSNNLFQGPGCSDGIQIGAYGVVVEGNVFDGIRQGSCAAHVDSIQLYGQSHTVIDGNLIRDFGDGAAIMAPNGGNHEQITNNVIDHGAGQTGSAVQLGGFRNGSLFAHNVVRGTDVFAHGPSITMRDNAMVDAHFSTTGSGCPAGCPVSHNLFSRARDASGSNPVVGTPQFVGGSNPTTYTGWTLADHSPGKHAASDGTDIGINSNVGSVILPWWSPGQNPVATTSVTTTRVMARQ
jgi:hypothetical protein